MESFELPKDDIANLPSTPADADYWRERAEKAEAALAARQLTAAGLSSLARYGFDGSMGADFEERNDGVYVKLADAQARVRETGLLVTSEQLLAVIHAVHATGRISLTYSTKDGEERPTNIAWCLARELLASASPAPAPEPSDLDLLDWMAQHQVGVYVVTSERIVPRTDGSNSYYRKPVVNGWALSGSAATYASPRAAIEAARAGGAR